MEIRLQISAGTNSWSSIQLHATFSAKLPAEVRYREQLGAGASYHEQLPAEASYPELLPAEASYWEQLPADASYQEQLPAFQCVQQNMLTQQIQENKAGVTWPPSVLAWVQTYCQHCVSNCVMSTSAFLNSISVAYMKSSTSSGS